MGVSKKEQKTIRYYDDNADEWIASHGFESSKKTFWMPKLAEFKHYVPSGTVLEIGCGGGREAVQFIKMGYSYVGIDAALGLINTLKQNFPFPQATFLHRDICDLGPMPTTFDGFWCAAVFLHLPKDRVNAALQNIKKVLKPGAVGFIALLEGEGEYFDDQTGRSFFLYTQKEFTDLLTANGFSIEKVEITKKETQKPWLATWQTYFVR